MFWTSVSQSIFECHYEWYLDEMQPHSPHMGDAPSGPHHPVACTAPRWIPMNPWTRGAPQTVDAASGYASKIRWWWWWLQHDDDHHHDGDGDGDGDLRLQHGWDNKWRIFSRGFLCCHSIGEQANLEYSKVDGQYIEGAAKPTTQSAAQQRTRCWSTYKSSFYYQLDRPP